MKNWLKLEILMAVAFTCKGRMTQLLNVMEKEESKWLASNMGRHKDLPYIVFKAKMASTISSVSKMKSHSDSNMTHLKSA